MDAPPVRLGWIPTQKGPTLVSMLYCHCLEILNSFLNEGDPTFSWPCKWCSCSWCQVKLSLSLITNYKLKVDVYLTSHLLVFWMAVCWDPRIMAPQTGTTVLPCSPHGQKEQEARNDSEQQPSGAMQTCPRAELEKRCKFLLVLIRAWVTIPEVKD